MAVSLPQRVRDLVRLGEDHRQARRPSDAIEVFNEALKLEPENEVALSGLGFTFLDVDDASGALPYFEKALSTRGRRGHGRSLYGAALATMSSIGQWAFMGNFLRPLGEFVNGCDHFAG